MKSFLLLPVLAVISMSNHKPSFFSQLQKIDTTVINHVMDGSVSEWPDSIFQKDNGTTIRYAVDNDSKNLFIAMKIPDFRVQRRMIRRGMNFYIDLKERKKESRGIEFPIYRKNDATALMNQRNKNFDQKTMITLMSLNLLSLKIFGFTNGRFVEQGLQVKGSVNISFSWDSTDVLYIEYLIPLKVFGNVSSLDRKTISLGWKINAADVQYGKSTSLDSRPPDLPPQIGYQENYNRGFSTDDPENILKEQSFWTKYTFHI